MTPSNFTKWRDGRRSVPRRTIAVAALMLAVGLTSEALAGVTVQIERSRQRMNVSVDGAHYATWAVSTARRGYITPPGTFAPYALQRMHYSRKYDNSPMPHSIFFYGGYAIHGTYEVGRLGRPVSHGCVRLRPANARALYGLISQHGMQNTLITIR